MVESVLPQVVPLQQVWSGDRVVYKIVGCCGVGWEMQGEQPRRSWCNFCITRYIKRQLKPDILCTHFIQSTLTELNAGSTHADNMDIMTLAACHTDTDTSIQSVKSGMNITIMKFNIPWKSKFSQELFCKTKMHQN